MMTAIRFISLIGVLYVFNYFTTPNFREGEDVSPLTPPPTHKICPCYQPGYLMRFNQGEVSHLRASISLLKSKVLTLERVKPW